MNLSGYLYVGTYAKIVKSYGNILEYFVGVIDYLSPLLSIISFIYLFCKKSIKYNIVISYLLTFSFMMLFVGMFNGMNIWYLFFQLTTGNILFLSVFCLSDYPITPITTEGQVIYGIILGVLTCILRFIIPELSVVIVLIAGPILFTKIINKLSIKLKYDKKYYYKIMILSIIIAIIITTVISIML